MSRASASAIVTGGGSGLGRATVRRLRAAGLVVTIADRDSQAGKEVEAEVGNGVHFEQTEITDDEAVAATVRGAARRGPLRVAVNCVGWGRGTPLLSEDGTAMPLEPFREVIDVNLVGVVNSMRHEAAAMAALPADDAGRRGVIINVSSIAGSDGPSSLLAYAAAKAGLDAITLPAARQLGTHGIRVMTIAPGYFLTPPWESAPEPQHAAALSTMPGPARFGQPQEFAELVAHIVENRYLNGTTIRLDAGARM